MSRESDRQKEEYVTLWPRFWFLVVVEALYIPICIAAVASLGSLAAFIVACCFLPFWLANFRSNLKLLDALVKIVSLLHLTFLLAIPSAIIATLFIYKKDATEVAFVFAFFYLYWLMLKTSVKYRAKIVAYENAPAEKQDPENKPLVMDYRIQLWLLVFLEIVYLLGGAFVARSHVAGSVIFFLLPFLLMNFSSSPRLAKIFARIVNVLHIAFLAAIPVSILAAKFYYRADEILTGLIFGYFYLFWLMMKFSIGYRQKALAAKF